LGRAHRSALNDGQRIERLTKALKKHAECLSEDSIFAEAADHVLVPLTLYEKYGPEYFPDVIKVGAAADAGVWVRFLLTHLQPLVIHERATDDVQPGAVLHRATLPRVPIAFLQVELGGHDHYDALVLDERQAEDRPMRSIPTKRGAEEGASASR
jgi:hypothetical protein